MTNWEKEIKEKESAIKMSKRFFAACIIANGLASTYDLKFKDIEFRRIAILSFSMADELLKMENE